MQNVLTAKPNGSSVRKPLPFLYLATWQRPRKHERHRDLGTKDLSGAFPFHPLPLYEVKAVGKAKVRSKLPNASTPIRYLLFSHSVVNPLDLSSARGLLQREHL